MKKSVVVPSLITAIIFTLSACGPISISMGDDTVSIPETHPP